MNYLPRIAWLQNPTGCEFRDCFHEYYAGDSDEECGGQVEEDEFIGVGSDCIEFGEGDGGEYVEGYGFDLDAVGCV